jgi:hypothetical protein
VVVVKHALAQRTSRLVRFYEAGEIGLGVDGFIYLRDGVQDEPGQASDRGKADRCRESGTPALIQALADSNGRRNEEAAVWELQRARWNQQWKSGWWLRDAQGKWSRKP